MSILVPQDANEYLQNTSNISSSTTNIQQENIELKVKVANLESRLTSFLSEANISEDKIQDVIKGFRKIDEITSQVNRYKSQIEENNSTIKNLKSQISDLHKQEDDLRKENAELNSKITVMQSRNGAMSPDNFKTVQTLKLENSQMKQEISTLESTNAELSIEILNLKSKLKDFDNEDSRTSVEIRQLKQANQELVNRNNILQQQLQDINTKNTKLSTKLADVSKINLTSAKDLMRTKEKLKTKEQLYQDAVELIHNRVSAMSSKIEKFNKQVVKRTGEINQQFSSKSKQKLQELTVAAKRRDEKTVSVIKKLSSMLASMAGIEQSKVPTSVIDFINKPGVFDSFVSLIERSAAIKETKQKTEIEQLKKLVAKARGQKRSGISPGVAELVKKMQENITEMTERVRTDHKALMDKIDANA